MLVRIVMSFCIKHYFTIGPYDVYIQSNDSLFSDFVKPAHESMLIYHG